MKTLFRLILVILVVVVAILIISNWDNEKKEVSFAGIRKDVNEVITGSAEEVDISTEIDWTKGVVSVTGIGSADPSESGEALARTRAEKSARIHAQEKLAESISGINISSVSTVMDEELKGTSISTNVSSFIKHAREKAVKINTLPDGSIQAFVTLEAPLTGETGLQDLVLDYDDYETTSTDLGEKASTTVDNYYKYTSLIINVADTEFEPALSPKIIDEAGNLVFDLNMITNLEALKDGVVDYYYSLENAKNHPDTGSQPLIIKALYAAGGLKKCDMVISLDDANIVRSNESMLKILKNGRVIVVFDK